MGARVIWLHTAGSHSITPGMGRSGSRKSTFLTLQRTASFHLIPGEETEQVTRVIGIGQQVDLA